MTVGPTGPVDQSTLLTGLLTLTGLNLILENHVQTSEINRKITVIRIEKLCTWKLLRSTRRTQIRYPHIRVMPLNTQTCNRPPPVICLTYVRNREYFPGWVPPSSISCRHTLRHTRHCVCLVLYCVTLFAVYLLFLPPLLSR